MGLGEFSYSEETSSSEEVASTLCDSNSQVNEVLSSGSSRGLGGTSNVVCGYRFAPNDLVLLIRYLLPMIMGVQLPCNIIKWIDHVYACDPNKLPINVIKDFRENEFYCFTRGAESERKADNGYWRQSGEDETIVDNSNEIVGFRKTLVFYQGNPEEKSDWIMHEYRMNSSFLPDAASQNQIIKDKLESFVVCRFQRDSDKNQDSKGEAAEVDFSKE